MTQRSATLSVKPGHCRFCGCDEHNVCVLTDDEGILTACEWLDSSRTVCSNPDCVAKLAETPLAHLVSKAAAS